MFHDERIHRFVFINLSIYRCLSSKTFSGKPQGASFRITFRSIVIFGRLMLATFGPNMNTFEKNVSNF